MKTRRNKLRHRKSVEAAWLSKAVVAMRTASRRDGVVVPVLVASAIIVIGVAGLGAASAAGPSFPDGVVDAGTLDDLGRAVRASASAAPADAAPQLALAYAESLTVGPLTQAAIDPIRRSYQLEPLGPDATFWRLGFVFNHWTAMPDDIRRSAKEELRAAFPRHGWAMRGLPDTITDPSGRMVSVLLFEQLRASQSLAANSSEGLDRSPHSR
jgi:hypothetical protein